MPRAPVDNLDAVIPQENKKNSLEFLSVVVLEYMRCLVMPEPVANGRRNFLGSLALAGIQPDVFAEMVDDNEDPLVLAVGFMSHVEEINLSTFENAVGYDRLQGTFRLTRPV